MSDLLPFGGESFVTVLTMVGFVTLPCVLHDHVDLELPDVGESLAALVARRRGAVSRLHVPLHDTPEVETLVTLGAAVRFVLILCVFKGYVSLKVVGAVQDVSTELARKIVLRHRLTVVVLEMIFVLPFRGKALSTDGAWEWHLGIGRVLLPRVNLQLSRGLGGEFTYVTL